jgi:transposase
MSVEGMGPLLAVEGATTARVFETYVEKMLVPSLEEGQVVVMDNLGAHRPKHIKELIEQQTCDLAYLMAYSPTTTRSKRRLPISRTCFAKRQPGAKRFW